MDSDLSEEMLLIFCGKCDPTQLGIVLNLCWKQDVFPFAVVYVFAKQHYLWPWAWVSKPAVCQECLLLLLFVLSFCFNSCNDTQSKRWSSTTKKGPETVILEIPLSKLFLTFVSEFCCGSFICCCQSWWVCLQICGISLSGWITAMTGNSFFSLLQSTIVTVFIDLEGIFSIL